MTSRAEADRQREMVEGFERLKREISYNPTRFVQMVALDSHLRLLAEPRMANTRLRRREQRGRRWA
jgi:hypothetical protein